MVPCKKNKNKQGSMVKPVLHKIKHTVSHNGVPKMHCCEFYG